MQNNVGDITLLAPGLLIFALRNVHAIKYEW